MKESHKRNILLRLLSNPMGIYLLLIIAFLLFCCVGIPILSLGHADGEQVPLMLLGHAMNAVAAGFILISVCSPVIYWRRYKKYMFIPLIIPILVTSLLVYWIFDIYVSNGYHFPL
jgi:hypothetical protein